MYNGGSPVQLETLEDNALVLVENKAERVNAAYYWMSLVACDRIKYYHKL